MLNEIIFKLEPGESGGQVESTEGWHCSSCWTCPIPGDLKDAESRKLARRRYIHQQLDDYVMALRKDTFTVEVYENNMVRLGQKDADMVTRLMQQATARTFINALVGAASAANCLKTLDSCLRRSDVGYC